MKILNAAIDVEVAEFLRGVMKVFPSQIELNRELKEKFGIVNFFEAQEDYVMLKNEFQYIYLHVAAPNPIEYGDFQTPSTLSDKICNYLLGKRVHPELLIEPTCGRGNFIISALRYLDSIENIYGIEIYKPYQWECKFRIIDYYLKNKKEKKPLISIFHQNIFNFNFHEILRTFEDEEILVLGNPPWEF